MASTSPGRRAGDARLACRLDGLGALHALLATGIGVARFTYATAYLPRYLEHEERPQADDGRRQPDLTGNARRGGGDGGTTAIQAMYHASSVLASC